LRVDCRFGLSLQLLGCLHALGSNGRSFFNGIIAAPASSAFDGRTDCPYRSAISTT
jgi:hypothetical protein